VDVLNCCGGINLSCRSGVGSASGNTDVVDDDDNDDDEYHETTSALVQAIVQQRAGACILPFQMCYHNERLVTAVTPVLTLQRQIAK
jgi:hypothetical protein